MLFSHHPPFQYDRTFLLFGTRFCVRCTGILFGILISPFFLFFEGIDWWIVLIASLILPIPAIVNFTLNELGKINNSTIKRSFSGVLLGMAIGLAFIELFLGQYLMGIFIITFIFILEIIVMIILHKANVLEDFIKQYEEGIYKECQLTTKNTGHLAASAKNRITARRPTSISH